MSSYFRFLPRRAPRTIYDILLSFLSSHVDPLTCSFFVGLPELFNIIILLLIEIIIIMIVIYIMSSSSVKGTNWTDGELRALLVLWAQPKAQASLNGVHRNKSFFELTYTSWVELRTVMRTGSARIRGETALERRSSKP